MQRDGVRSLGLSQFQVVEINSNWFEQKEGHDTALHNDVRWILWAEESMQVTWISKSAFLLIV